MSDPNPRLHLVRPPVDPVVAREVVVVYVRGEVDRTTSSLLHDDLGRALDREADGVVVDLSRMGFCDLGGYDVLERAARAAAGSGIGFAVSGYDAHQEGVMAVLWAVGGPARYASTRAAVVALGRRPTADPIPVSPTRPPVPIARRPGALVRAGARWCRRR